MTVISTSTTSTATAYSNQRKIDRCQNGVLWAVKDNGSSGSASNFHVFYSTDGGATWTYDSYVPMGGTRNYTPNISLFIDVDDYAHVAYKDQNDGYIYYRRGTPNAARTSWTWSSAVAVHSGTTRDYPDVIAHREGTGWVAWVPMSSTEASFDRIEIRRVDITSGGSISLGAGVFSSTYGNSNHKWPSIDFNHTGDGKTVAGSTPHLYAAWSAGATGSGKGIRFKKATYSGGSWTWGTEREIDSTRYNASSASGWWNTCLFDGARVIIVGHLSSGGAGNDDTMLYERDAADTTTTTRVLADNTLSNYRFFGSSTYDGDGNVYFFGVKNDAAPHDLGYRKWERATTTLGANTALDADTGNTWASAKRGYSEGLVEFIYTDGTANPYSITYDSILLNADPNTPTNLSVTSDVTDNTPVFEADVSDPNASQQIKGRFQIYQSDGTTLVGTVDSSFTDGSHTASAEYASALPVGTYKVQAATVDDAGAISSYTSQITFYVKTTVTDDLQLIWGVNALISKDLGLVWNVNISNQKDLELTWNVREQVLDSLELLWGVDTPWTLLEADPENNPVTWDKVAP